MKSCKPIYEFIVWENCNNHCQFCFQRENPKIFNQLGRANALESVLNFVNSDKFIFGSHLLIVGGEIFHLTHHIDQSCIKAFYHLIIEHMKSGRVDLLYFNTNLIYTYTGLLDEVLQEIKENNLLNRVRFTTSYDLVGRFATEKSRNDFLFNLHYFRNKYPDLHMVVNTILTKSVCQKIINKEISIKELIEDFGCWINLIPYIVYDEKLSASRNEIFTALRTVEDEINGYLKQYIENLDLDQDKFVYINNNGNFELCKSEENECGHSINFTRYSTKGSCYICDIKELFSGSIC